MRRFVHGALVASAVVGLGALGFVVPVSSGAVGSGGVSPLIYVGPKVSNSVPPSSAFCISNFGIACYAPSDMAAQYDFTSAYQSGDTGTGQTIVIFDSFGSPTIASDLATFDTNYGIPAPPSFNVYMPEGNVTYSYVGASPSSVMHNKSMQTEINWAYETTLDVEWAHAMAPGASIALVVTPNPESEGVQGLTNLENAQQWALDHHLGTIWSDSWATTEQAFNTPSTINQLNALYARAAAAGVSAFFATGDGGSANANFQGVTYPYPTVNFPSSSPNVISVGGTQINTPVDSISSYNPESVWNDGFGAGGGGYSTIFAEPGYQSASSISDSGATRGLPDVSYNAAVLSAILIWESFDPTAPPSWVPIAGTSAATPQWAAVDAIVNQADGAQGFLAPKLYELYQNSEKYASAFHDIATGNNAFGGVAGYSAGTGWDAASGLGTPDVGNLVKVLAP